MAQLIVALDFPRREAALSLARDLRGFVPWCKVGLELFTLGGPALIEALKSLQYNVFLDLKFYDIPHTVAQAVKAAASLGIDMLTLHCQGGERMCREAVEAASGVAQGKPLLFGVTVLTSFMPGEMPGISAAPAEHALALARGARAWGLDGVVCSGHEAGQIKAALPALQCLCPGIRPAGSSAGDQRRIMTPARAVAEGADFLVVGRPITGAPSPVEAARRILAEMAHGQCP